MSEQEPFNSGDEIAVSKKMKKVNAAAEHERERVRRAMGNADSRWFIYSFINKSGIHAPCFVQGMPDVTAKNEGARELGLLFYALIDDACPELFALAKREANQKEVDSE